MSSREIADLTGKEHFHVKRDIEVMLSQLNLDPSNFGCIFLDSLNREQKGYALDKDLTTCLVSGYNVQLRMAIIKRWTELEQQTQFKLPSTYKEALLALVTAEEEKEHLTLQVASQQQVIEVQQVDVDALERLSSRKGSMAMRDAAKLLNMRPMDLRDWMLENNWTYSPYQDCYRPTAAHSNAGHLVLSANDYKPLVRVTWKGLVLLSKKLKVTLDVE
ncbi:phage regulatory protein/antirepressor Ant [Acinetobacter baumannii]|nr:phage regulatory protein/antirepressor Ant [Acinetobacter baumannii]MDW5367048.1 phage regulatory protein/antirepressor Ant [Acinetobacter baumannii]MDW5382287.1 phage regulatory protein/antirepressor Ant [Acinetobacter baumannii]